MHFEFHKIDYAIIARELRIKMELQGNTDCDFDIPDLPPEFTFRRLLFTAEAIDFSFELKRAAMGPHIIQRWAWDETFQRELHTRHFQHKPFFEIRKAEQPIGTLSFQIQSEYIRFGEFYLLPDMHGSGIGSAILRHCLCLADELAKPVRLEYLHWNPVSSLYGRHGFHKIGQSEIHCFMERQVFRNVVQDHSSP